MNFTYEFPDITGYIQKSGTYKKPRRISGLRLGENRTAVEKRFPLSLSRRDEDKDIDYFTVSTKEKISLFDEEVASLGCSFVKGKAALLFADFTLSTEEMKKTPDFSFRQAGESERCFPLDGRGNFHLSHGK